MVDQNSIWKKTKSLLVFYVFTDHEEFQQFRESLDAVLIDSNVKRLKVIILITNPKESVLKHSLFTYFCEKDLSLFGNKIKKSAIIEAQEDVDSIRDTHFDLFVCFGKPSTKVLKWLEKINATRRIGVNSEGQSFFDLNFISSIDSIDNGVVFASEMLNKII